MGPDGTPTPVQIETGGTGTVDFYYRGPRSAMGIQGLSMAVRYACAFTALPSSLDLSAGALAAAGTEFVELSVDNDATDGDGCEMSFAAVVDSDFPLEGRGLPQTTEFSRLFSLEFAPSPGTPCGECVEIVFADGVANGTPPVVNVATVDFQSVRPELRSGELCVVGPSVFLRGDCNVSEFVDVSDPIGLIGSLFLGSFTRPCDDACDADDDGRLTLGDAIYTLSHLFLSARPPPPAPGPRTPGPDPTADDLDCKTASRPCS